MDLEVGKEYRTRSGLPVKVIQPLSNDGDKFQVAKVVTAVDGHLMVHKLSGLFGEDGDDPLDVVEEIRHGPDAHSELGTVSLETDPLPLDPTAV